MKCGVASVLQGSACSNGCTETEIVDEEEDDNDINRTSGVSSLYNIIGDKLPRHLSLVISL